MDKQKRKEEMKIVLVLLSMVYLTYADDYIKNIEDEIYAIKKFDKYKDAPYPEPDFVEVTTVKLLGWSENNYLAYFLEEDGVHMSDTAYGTLFIRNIYSNKIIYLKKFEQFGGDIETLYQKNEKEIQKTLNKYNIKFEKKPFLKNNKRFSMKNIYKKAPSPIGFGRFPNYLESISIYVDKKGKKVSCSHEVMNTETYYHPSDGIHYKVLEASLLGVLSSPTVKDVTAVVVAYVQTNNAEGNSADIKILTCNSSDTKVMYINELPNWTIYSFCKATGIKESVIRKLNPWINKRAGNILSKSAIIVPKGK